MAPPAPVADVVPVMDEETDTAPSSYDDWAVEDYKLKRARITDGCPDLDLRETRLQRARVALLFRLLGSPNMFGALRQAGVLPCAPEAPVLGTTERPGTVCFSDEDRGARLFVVQSKRISAVWTYATEREVRLLRAHDALLRNLRMEARARGQTGTCGGSQR